MSAATSNWKRLFDIAMPAIDHVFRSPQTEGTPDWTFGGGTALMLQIGHRISFDIDIFVHAARLKSFSPSINPAAADISTRYQWPGHYLKFELPDGEIDFLSAPLQTDPGFTWKQLGNRSVAIETPEEIIVKKIRYRSESLKARDAFDLAAIARERPDLAETLASEVGDALPRTSEALRVIAARGWKSQSTGIIPTPKTEALLPEALGIAQRVIDIALAHWKDREQRPANRSAEPTPSKPSRAGSRP